MTTHALRHGDPRHHPETIARLKARVAELEAVTGKAEDPQFPLYWGQPDDVGWHRDHKDWLCRCGAEVSVEWRSFCSLLDTDEAIVPADANASWWQLGCARGHVLLLAHEYDEEGGDTCPAPTTGEIVERLASPADVAAWRSTCPGGTPS